MKTMEQLLETLKHYQEDLIVTRLDYFDYSKEYDKPFYRVEAYVGDKSPELTYFVTHEGERLQSYDGNVVVFHADQKALKPVKVESVELNIDGYDYLIYYSKGFESVLLGGSPNASCEIVVSIDEVFVKMEKDLDKPYDLDGVEFPYRVKGWEWLSLDKFKKVQDIFKFKFEKEVLKVLV